MPRFDDSAALASNWRTVLAVDAALGAVASAVGLVLALTVSLAAGLVLVVAGAAYCALVGTRARRWARLRREAAQAPPPVSSSSRKTTSQRSRQSSQR